MGAHLYRRTRRRDATTDAKITFEAHIPSRERQFNTPRVARAGCACPAKQYKQPSRGSLATVGLLQNWGIRRGPVPGRVRRSWECGARREKRRRAGDVVVAGAVDAARAGTHLVERTDGERGGKGVRNQPRGRHPMATSVFTQYAIQDLHDHSLRYVSTSKFFFSFKDGTEAHSMNLAFFFVPPVTLPSPDGDRGEILGLPGGIACLAENALYCI